MDTTRTLLPTFSVFKDFLGSFASKDGRTYQVTCTGPCRGITARITATSGDPDLYGKEGAPPIIRVRDETASAGKYLSRSGSAVDV